MGDGVDSVINVEEGHSEGLLGHRALVGVPGRLVVVTEWNKTGYDSKDYVLADFDVGCGRVDVFRFEGN